MMVALEPISLTLEALSQLGISLIDANASKAIAESQQQIQLLSLQAQANQEDVLLFQKLSSQIKQKEAQSLQLKQQALRVQKSYLLGLIIACIIALLLLGRFLKFAFNR
jgi:hypothetical protein